MMNRAPSSGQASVASHRELEPLRPAIPLEARMSTSCTGTPLTWRRASSSRNPRPGMTASCGAPDPGRRPSNSRNSVTALSSSRSQPYLYITLRSLHSSVLQEDKEVTPAAAGAAPTARSNRGFRSKVLLLGVTQCRRHEFHLLLCHLVSTEAQRLRFHECRPAKTQMSVTGIAISNLRYFASLGCFPT